MRSSTPAWYSRSRRPSCARACSHGNACATSARTGDDVAVFFVEAPAGHGKTSLLAQWRLDWLQAGAVVAWLSMDAEDSPITVVSGIVHGLRRSIGQATFGNDAIEAVRRGAGTAHALTSLLAEITEAATPTVLIFDNCERIGDPAVLEIFDYLLHNLPPNLQLAAGSRAPPPLHTADLLAHGSLRRVTAGELRFDLAETIRLLSERLGSRVDADLCARLHEITEGWPLGLAARGRGAGANDGSGAHHPVVFRIARRSDPTAVRRHGRRAAAGACRVRDAVRAARRAAPVALRGHDRGRRRRAFTAATAGRDAAADGG